MKLDQNIRPVRDNQGSCLKDGSSTTEGEGGGWLGGGSKPFTQGGADSVEFLL